MGWTMERGGPAWRFRAGVVAFVVGIGLVSNVGFAKTHLGDEALKLLFESYRIERDLPGMDELKAALLADKLDVSPSLKANVLAAIAAFRAGLLAQRASGLTPDKAAEAAKLYEEAARSVPELRHRATLLKNASVTWERAGKLDHALRTIEQARKAAIAARDLGGVDPAAHGRLLRVLLRKAALQQAAFDIKGAVLTLQAAFETSPRSIAGQNALIKATQLAEKTEQWRLALGYWKQVVEVIDADHPQVDAIVERAAARRFVLARDHGDRAVAVKAARRLIERTVHGRANRTEQLKAHVWLAKRYREARNEKASLRHLDTVIAEVAAVDRTDPSGRRAPLAHRRVAAEAAFERLEPRFDAHIAATLQPPAGMSKRKRLRWVLHASQRLVRSTLYRPKNSTKRRRSKTQPKGLYWAYIEDVAAWGASPWSYAGYFRAGRVLLHAARILATAPLPPDLSEEEEDVASEMIERVILQLENRALGDMATALRNARKQGVMNPWVRKLHAELHRYRPNEFPMAKPAKDAGTGQHEPQSPPKSP